MSETTTTREAEALIALAAALPETHGTLEVSIHNVSERAARALFAAISPNRAPTLTRSAGTRWASATVRGVEVTCFLPHAACSCECAGCAGCEVTA